ncbi:unnamed protein product [Adineta ricciae]|uniref:Uncharacterized protein n=1 Tax=Adineta ricciae TaxID=249248 RepID=A0A815V4G3_ADIRI|nr:unnamed protein product [Adineta ricciae]
MNNVNDERTLSIDADEYKKHPRNHISRSSSGSTSSSTTNGIKRVKDIPPCVVCGADAHGYNFDQITCESCKAFFRRNALKSMDKFRCRNNDKCVITVATRKRCKRCRLLKCFQCKMRKDWILSDEEKIIKREKVERNRLLKQKAQIVSQQVTTTNETTTNFRTLIKSSSATFPILTMYPPSDQKLYDRQQYLLGQLSHGYQSICHRYPQPSKFLYRNTVILQMEDSNLKLASIKDLTRELTQMTTVRLLNFFNLIPEFQLLTQHEKTSILIQNMLSVFMFHGALTYNVHTDTFVDRTTNDEPYDAKYLSYVYGPKLYHDFVVLAKDFLSATYQSTNDKQADEHSHTVFLLLMTILLFSHQCQIYSSEEQQTKLKKIQQIYIDITCRFLHDRFGSTVGQRMFQQLIPLLIDLQTLCSTLANVNLCEMVEDDNRSSSRSVVAHFDHQSCQSSSEFDSTMISGTSHLNELQKENRSPYDPIQSSPMYSTRSSPSILSNTIVTTPSSRNY